MKSFYSVFGLATALRLMEAAPAGADGPGAQVLPSKAKSEVEKVKMSDGREVEFAGKRKLLKEVLIEGVTEGYTGPLAVRFDFRNGETRTFVIPSELKDQLAGHGASQKIGDETAGEEDVDDMVLAVDSLIERLTKLEWSAKREGGGFGGTSVLLRALVEHSGKPIETIKAFLAAKSQQEKMALRAHPSVKAIVDRLEAEKLAKATGANKVDANALLAAI